MHAVGVMQLQRKVLRVQDPQHCFHTTLHLLLFKTHNDAIVSFEVFEGHVLFSLDTRSDERDPHLFAKAYAICA